MIDYCQYELGGYFMTKSRFQLVGSLLRPQNLLDYKTKIEHRDDIQFPFYDDFKGYQEAETEAIKEVVQTQLAHGIDVLTDGEYSKSMWHLDFVWGLSGVERYIKDEGYQFKDLDGHSQFETRRDIGIRITEPLSGKNHHGIQIYKQIVELAENQEVKLTAWGPAHAFTELGIFNGLYGEDQVYKTKEAFKEGLIQAYQEFVTDYKEAGGKIIQFDDCLWELFAEDNESSPYKGGTEAVSGLVDEFVAINNAVVDYAHDLGLTVWTHNCRGNYQSRHMSGGTYQAIAEKFLRDQHYDRYFLEWDDERAGELSALSVLKDKPNVEVVLGLLSSKTNHLDDEERVYHLLDQASQILPKERLYLSHQCGFASCDCGNELTIEEQWKKIDQGIAIADTYWK